MRNLIIAFRNFAYASWELYMCVCVCIYIYIYTYTYTYINTHRQTDISTEFQPVGCLFVFSECPSGRKSGGARLRLIEHRHISARHSPSIMYISKCLTSEAIFILKNSGGYLWTYKSGNCDIWGSQSIIAEGWSRLGCCAASLGEYLARFDGCYCFNFRNKTT